MLNKQSGLRSIDSFNELDGEHVEMHVLQLINNQ